MKLRKLNAISSTSDYLKELSVQETLDNFTVISTNYQTLGRGQVTNKWISEKGKNLLFSVLINFNDFKIENNAFLNFAISNGIYQVLQKYIPQIKVKWPNDIMAGNKKICGILIENTVKGTQISHSIVGVGLNVNQIVFPKDLPNATSLKCLLGKSINLDKLLEELIFSIKEQIQLLESDLWVSLKANYEKVLFKNTIPSMFATKSGDVFLGKIIGVSDMGLLRIELENGTIKEFANKEVRFA